jgi:hypothetical protein
MIRGEGKMRWWMGEAEEMRVICIINSLFGVAIAISRN